MMEVIDLLNGRRNKISLNELIFLKKRNTDYILSVPHSGTLIPVKNKFNIGKHLLIGTDLFADKLYDTGQGISIISRLNSYFVNVSRSREGNKDKSLPRHLQTDPLHGISLTGDKILKEEYSSEEKRKILDFYDQYHALLKKAIQEIKQKHGYALIFDCHSMGSIGMKNTPDEGKQRPDFTIGTLNDTSAHPKIISVFHETLKNEAEKSGLIVKKNDPYKGGFITQKYAKPSNNIHVIQLETKKSNYMNEGLGKDSSEDFKLNLEGFKKINLIISKTIQATSEETKKIYSHPKG